MLARLYSSRRYAQIMPRRPLTAGRTYDSGDRYLATLFVFGLKRGVGAETISVFFSHLHVEAHVGCSPSALRHIMHTLEALILETGAAWEQEGIAQGEIRPVIGAVVEIFMQDMQLVIQDLTTGY